MVNLSIHINHFQENLSKRIEYNNQKIISRIKQVDQENKKNIKHILKKLNNIELLLFGK